MKAVIFIWSLFVVYLTMVFTESTTEAAWMKPILIPSLFLLMLGGRKILKHQRLVGALVLSTVGDILLIFEGRPFFILGLLSFLLAHLLYIFIFRSKVGAIKRDAFSVICTLFILVYYVSFMCFLWPHLGAMRIPVLAYAFVISGMLWMALQLLRSTSSFRWHIVLGALFFVVSDSLLSIQLFYSSFELAHFYVMLTYLLAQFLLVYGILNFRNERP